MDSSFTKEVMEEFRGSYKVGDVRRRGKYAACYLLFDYEAYRDVLERLDALTERHTERGERIRCQIGRGAVVDMGVETILVRGGVCWELYDYEELSLAFVRLYSLEEGERRWVALYVDENPETPWWSKEERGGTVQLNDI